MCIVDPNDPTKTYRVKSGQVEKKLLTNYYILYYDPMTQSFSNITKKGYLLYISYRVKISFKSFPKWSGHRVRSGQTVV